MAIHLGRPLPDASCDLPGRRRGNPPCRTEIRRVAPTRSCSRWGLPCRRRRRRRGALLPHPFTLTRLRQGFGGRFAFCGTFPRVAPAGRYPAPCSRGARTFLPPGNPGRRPSGRLTPSNIIIVDDYSINSIKPFKSDTVSKSASPVIRSGRKWRWKAVITPSAPGS